jgi:hypothetical protein
MKDNNLPVFYHPSHVAVGHVALPQQYSVPFSTDNQLRNQESMLPIATTQVLTLNTNNNQLVFPSMPLLRKTKAINQIEM